MLVCVLRGCVSVCLCFFAWLCLCVCFSAFAFFCVFVSPDNM